MTTDVAVDPRQVLRSQVRAHFFEFRAVEPGDGERADGRTLEGYAAVFDQPTVIESYAGTFEETVARGAFRKTLRERKPVMQFDHGNDKRVGTAPIGSIDELYEDDAGLFVRGRLLDTPRVEDIRQAIEVGAIRGMSFKFRVMQDRWIDRNGKKIRDDELADLLEDPGERGPIRREITEVQLFELGPVVFPAYEQTSVGVRSSLPAGSPFNPNALALRGVIAQFGLDARCIKRHLGVFDADARRALAEEIAGTFPELLEVLAARAVTPPAEGDTETTAEPAAEVTGQSKTTAEPAPATRQRSTEPVARHSGRPLREASWYLAPRH
ncbi:HK97 family phage prohead protease [Verrucosispora sp. WMMD1129]|uniref:HK97 family phage prohead protease n=1 Tax=Verrucosispora sp. WMMD1129 TaxID=3016093 RepID=UPI00249C1E12|nr:HK97 family phage prohead protease [Verrucosispora sp. WMMD1129]WFE45314.1 HK97 family phage prohead protease [Verrucosispora sp. WMMD1129]